MEWQQLKQWFPSGCLEVSGEEGETERNDLTESSASGNRWSNSITIFRAIYFTFLNHSHQHPFLRLWITALRFPPLWKICFEHGKKCQFDSKKSEKTGLFDVFLVFFILFRPSLNFPLLSVALSLSSLLWALRLTTMKERLICCFRMMNGKKNVPGNRIFCVKYFIKVMEQHRHWCSEEGN